MGPYMHVLTNNMSEAIQDLSVNSMVLLVCSNLSFPAGIDDVTHHMFQFTDHVPVNVHTLTIWDELTNYSFIVYSLMMIWYAYLAIELFFLDKNMSSTLEAVKPISRTD